MTSENETPIPDVDFSQLLLGFASATLYYCGESSTTGQTSGEKNRDLAMQNLNIVKLLQQKTAGNLNESEENLMLSILQDLQTKFVQAFPPQD
ncbi:MAG: DUF1844 domain-containing protein [Zetaproteobacteria bacterium]|nr:DUF1844 domain-containing protein [Zetaproteobacteria bacterium]